MEAPKQIHTLRCVQSNEVLFKFPIVSLLGLKRGQKRDMKCGGGEGGIRRSLKGKFTFLIFKIHNWNSTKL